MLKWKQTKEFHRVLQTDTVLAHLSKYTSRAVNDVPSESTLATSKVEKSCLQLTLGPIPKTCNVRTNSLELLTNVSELNFVISTFSTVEHSKSN